MQVAPRPYPTHQQHVIDREGLASMLTEAEDGLGMVLGTSRALGFLTSKATPPLECRGDSSSLTLNCGLGLRALIDG